MQDEVNEKTMALCIKGGKISAQLLKAALTKLLSEIEKKKQQSKKMGGQNRCKRGKQSIKSLQQSGAQLTNIVVTDNNIKSFDRVARKYGIGIKILDSQITALEAELERYSNLKIRLYQDLCDDVVSREEYGEMNTRFAQKIKEAQDKIQEIREKKQEALKHDTLLPTWLEEFKQYEHIKMLERRVVVELIDHIDVHSKTEIEIHFCFEDELHSITEKFMEYQAHHGNEVAEE